jgi:glyoxylase-like metal-dependent hydrolase (beta-lactamase superfamily II)
LEIIDGVYGVDFDGMVWGYIYRKGTRLTLIDCGVAGRVELLTAKLHEIGARLSDIDQLILTHGHEDHAGTASELQRMTGITTLCHKLDAPFVRGEARMPPPVMTENERRLHDQIAGNMPPAPPARVDRELNAGDIIDIGDPAVVVHAPGHTPGSIAIWVESRRLLFTGDAAASLGRPIVGVFNIDPAQARESFKRLADVDCETACFGHGPQIPAKAGELMRQVAAYL